MLLIQAPYPGESKFVGQPTSLLAAISQLGPRFRSGLGYVDRQWIAGDVAERVRGLCRAAPVRTACISSSTAATREATAIARVLREELGDSVLIVAGGPHEDDCQEKMATRIPEIDISIAGEAEHALAAVLHSFLTKELTSQLYLTRCLSELDLSSVPGKFTISTETKTHAYAGPNFTPTPFGHLPRIREAARFDCFRSDRTIQLMLTRGCPYGQCTFCAEPNNEYFSASQYDWVRDVIDKNPGAALYFQDSVMPLSRSIRERLLPLLAESGVEWGCQLFLPMASRSYIETLIRHGCVYLYTGLETASPSLRRALGKAPIDEPATLDRLRAASDLGGRWGISLIFGVIDRHGALVETATDVGATLEFADRVKKAGNHIEGFYPNILTVLPGTAIDRGLRERGVALDFYNVPRETAFDAFEDGGVGFNFLNVPSGVSVAKRHAHVRLLNESARHVQSLGSIRWGDPLIRNRSARLEEESISSELLVHVH